MKEISVKIINDSKYEKQNNKTNGFVAINKIPLLPPPHFLPASAKISTPSTFSSQESKKKKKKMKSSTHACNRFSVISSAQELGLDKTH